MPDSPERLNTTFALRLERYGDEIRDNLRTVYGEAADAMMIDVVRIMRRAFGERPDDLRLLDERRLLRPDWLQAPTQIGYVAYADRYAGDLSGVRAHLDHLSGLGVTYLHLMPLLKPRPGANDGGYAVMDYRAVRDDLGTLDDLRALASDLRARGISLVLDLVLNHVAREHEWAARARAGEQRYRDYFHTFADRTEPDAYEQALPEVFPDFAPGNFTFDDELGAWVWTTFNRYQWDVNWANPAVFCEYLDIICALANAGVEVVRLDAIAFIWKRLGTICQGEPEVHAITHALRAALRVVAPALAFKAEAIVGPEQLMPYLGQGRHAGKVSEMAYHNGVMVQWWSALACGDTRLFVEALRGYGPKPASTTWASYVRCHDDIGWAISDADAARVGLDGAAHRHFLSDFYSGEFPGSFARGLVFQHNEATGDRRISGSLASLAGLEAAEEAGDSALVDAAVARIVLLQTAMLGFGGVPLLYMGDEIGMTNDDGFVDDPEHADDNRWAHRPRLDWDAVAAAEREAASGEGASPQARILAAVRRAIAVRKATPQLHASVESLPLDSPDARVLLLFRDHPEGRMVQVYNVAAEPVELPLWVLREQLGEGARELLGGHAYDLTPASITVPPYAAWWFVAR